MQTSYTLTPILSSNLSRISELRSKILLEVISRQDEMQFRFESMIDRLYWSLNLTESSLTKQEVINVIKNSFGLIEVSSKKFQIPHEKMILGYKKAHDHINNNWYASKKSVTTKDITHLMSILEIKKIPNNPLELEKNLKYLNESSSNPVIQAAIAQILFVNQKFFEDGNGRLSRLMSLLYLYKHGYDFRGFLVLDEYFRKDIAVLEVINRTIRSTGSLNIWLEHYSSGMVSQLEKTLEKIQNSNLDPSRQSQQKLNERQKKILDLSSLPESTITNKKVQKTFGVSQITASRDLAKLSSYGFLVPHGKGRSVYYTRII